MTRQIVLDTETTGLNPKEGHRIIEIGCLELVDRRLTGKTFHRYINPNRSIDAGAIAVHGITNEFLADKPLFADLIEEFLTYIQGAELIIHNAPFDLSFLNYELALAKNPVVLEKNHSILDTLVLAREMHPRQKNSLDALCKRYQVNNSHRDYHGALVDADLLAQVYLAMTGGQKSLFKESVSETSQEGQRLNLQKQRLERDYTLKIIKADENELSFHEAQLETMKKKQGKCLWLEEK